MDHVSARTATGSSFGFQLYSASAAVLRRGAARAGYEQCNGRAENRQALTGTLAVRSSLPQLTQAPLMARRIAFQMQ